MELILSKAKVYTGGRLKESDILISDGLTSDIVPDSTIYRDTASIDLSNYIILPGLVDVHVHLREPGFLYKETIETGTMAAARGGYTAVCAMPNLSPVPDCPENLKAEQEAIRASARVHVYPYGTITRGQAGEELSDMEGLARSVIAFSDDGRGVQNDDMMRRAMRKAKSLHKLIVAHCEDSSLLNGGYIHDGDYARAHGHRGISSESEWRQIERDLTLVRETGCRYHVCHVSTEESVALLRKAKAQGLDVTCETAPHYLLLSDKDLQEDGRFKMNPPLRGERDRQALLEGLCDGTIDMIATDHAPHSAEEKSKGLAGSTMGIVGLETAFSLLYTHLVRSGILSLDKLITLMHVSPARRFGITGGTVPDGIEIGKPADLTVFDLHAKQRITPAEFLSKGRSTPFEGWEVWGKCVMTMVGGKIVFQEGKA